MGEKNVLASIPNRKMPERERTLLQRLYDETNGGFGFADALDAYGKRARKLRTEALDTLESSTAPGTDPFIGAGRKALGTVQLLAHPFMALAPSPEEMQQRAIDAGNPEWAGAGWALGNLVNLPSPSDSATVLATLGKGLAATKAATPLVPAMAPLVGKMAVEVDNVADAGRALAMTDWKDNLFIKRVDPSTLTFKETMQNNTGAIDDMFPETSEMFPALVTRGSDGELSIIDGHNRARVAMLRGDQLPVLEIPSDVYELLKGKGFDDMQITHAMLERAGQTDAANGIRRTFVGLDREFFKTEDEINSIIDGD